MGDFNIQVEAGADELHEVLLSEIEAADLDWQAAQAARTGMTAALSFLNVVGDNSVDAGVDVSIEGESGKNIMVSVVAVPATETPDAMNVPVDDENVENVEDRPPVMIAGQVTPDPDTGDPIVDNFPGHPETSWVESVPEEAVIEEPPEAVEQPEPEPPAEPKPSIEQPDATGEPAVVEHQQVDELVAEEEDEPEIDIEGKTVDQILWQVGDDRSLAEEALTQEEATDRPRKTLIDKLEEIIEEGGA